MKREGLVLEEGWTTAVLVGGMVLATFQAFVATGWGERTQIVPLLALVGVLVGLAAAKSALRSFWALPLALVAGVELQIVAQALGTPGSSWNDRLGQVVESLRRWLALTLSRGVEHDQLVLAVVFGLTAFLLGFTTSWLAFRPWHGWLALILNATVGVIHLSYATVDALPPFLASLLLGVMMVSSLELHLRRSAWQAAGVAVQAAPARWTLAAAALLATASLVLAGQLPAGEANPELARRFQDLTEPWKDLQQQVDHLVGGSRGQARPGSRLAFGESLAPRGDFEPGSEPVLKIASPQRRYWRTSTYDRYDGSSISSSSLATERFEAGTELPLDPAGTRRRLSIEQTVTVLAPSSVAVFSADTPLRISQPTTLDRREVPWDSASLRFSTPLSRDQSYTVTSLVLVVPPDLLAEVPGTYPAWVERYLELPVSLPSRVGALANQLTAGQSNPLYRALAIENHLRSLTYSTHTIPPPPDRDWVDFVLFDSQQGYCDYFATAMAVLLRTQGIPARVASGFAPGTFDPAEGVWLVRESDAHSWTEVYFPGYGWIPFEPSAIRATPERFAGGSEPQARPGADAGSDSTVPERPDEDQAPAGSTTLPPRPARPTPVGLGLLITAVLVLGLGLASAVLASYWERGLADEPPARRRYAQLLRWLRLGGWPLRRGETPYELARRLEGALPDLAPEIAELARLHVERTYGPSGRPDDAERAERLWQRLAGPLAGRMLRRRFQPRQPVEPDPAALGGDRPERGRR